MCVFFQAFKKRWKPVPSTTTKLENPFSALSLTMDKKQSSATTTNLSTPPPKQVPIDWAWHQALSSQAEIQWRRLHVLPGETVADLCDWFAKKYGGSASEYELYDPHSGRLLHHSNEIFQSITAGAIVGMMLRCLCNFCFGFVMY
jgi:hypothetical protein